MRPPPPLSRLPFFPVTGGVVLLAIVASAAGWMGYDTRPLKMSYLAFHGQPWRLVTCAFVHVNIIHLAFDAYWVWALGAVVEEEFGHLPTVALYLLLAVGSSAAEYAFTVGGVGLSGVAYGIFGFLWVLSCRDPRFEDAMDKGTTQVLVGWFFLCIVLTVAKVLAIGNFAHGAGAIIGGLTGLIIERRRRIGRLPTRITAAIALAALLAGAFWAATAGRPIVNFSHDASDDLINLGYDALNRNDNERALRYLKIATSMRYPDPKAWLDLGVAYQRLGRDNEAEAAFRKAAAAGAIDGQGNPVKLPDR